MRGLSGVYEGEVMRMMMVMVVIMVVVMMMVSVMIMMTTMIVGVRQLIVRVCGVCVLEVVCTYMRVGVYACVFCVDVY